MMCVVADGAGAADEELFIKSFEQVPHVSIFNAKDLHQELNEVLQVLNDASIDWEKRVENVKRIRSVVLSGVTDWGLDEFAQRFKDMELALNVCLKDLRSKVVREACVTIAFLCQCLGIRMDRFCEGVMPVLFTLIPNSAKIMSTSGFVCIRFVIQYTHAPRLIPVICMNMSSKSKEIRKACCEFLDQLLHTWPTHSLEKHMATLQKAIMLGISDADSEARVFARRAFWAFAEHFKDQADGMIHSLDQQKQKVLLGEVPGTLSASNSTSSLFNSTANGRSNASSVRQFVPTQRPVRQSVSTSNSVENLLRPWSAMAATRVPGASRSRIPVFSPKESSESSLISHPSSQTCLCTAIPHFLLLFFLLRAF
jgi:CLIP-associating protein 1/2